MHGNEDSKKRGVAERVEIDAKAVTKPPGRKVLRGEKTRK